MPLDVLGCTRATLMRSTSVSPCPIGLGNLLNTHRDGDRLLQLLIFNEEFLVMMDHQFIVITSLPFVHTARRSYRLSNPVNISDRLHRWFATFADGKSSEPYCLEEGEVVTRFP